MNTLHRPYRLSPKWCMVGRARDVFDALWEGKGRHVPLTFPPCIILGISDMVYTCTKCFSIMTVLQDVTACIIIHWLTVFSLPSYRWWCSRVPAVPVCPRVCRRCRVSSATLLMPLIHCIVSVVNIKYPCENVSFLIDMLCSKEHFFVFLKKTQTTQKTRFIICKWFF